MKKETKLLVLLVCCCIILIINNILMVYNLKNQIEQERIDLYHKGYMIAIDDMVNMKDVYACQICGNLVKDILIETTINEKPAGVEFVGMEE